MKIISTLLCGLASWLVPSALYSDMFAPSHSCYKPMVPYEFEDEWALRRFQNEVEDYQRCLQDFVQEQEEAIREHSEALDDAVSEWENFVNYELP